MKVYILLPIHNRIEKTRLFIDCLLAQTYQNYHLVLIDDGSTDGTQDYVRGKVKDLTVLTGKGDWWWGGGLHQGYLWLKKNCVSPDDLVLMINNDTEFAQDFFQIAVELMNRSLKTLLQARVYSQQDGRLIDPGMHVDWRRLAFDQAKKINDINCLSTRGLFLRVNDLLDIGGFRPVMIPHYMSDCEFTIRAHRKGYRLMTDVSLKLTVDESTTGDHGTEQALGWNEFLKEYFSKRSAHNLLSGFAFLVFACPWPWKLVNIFRVVSRMVKKSIWGVRK